MGGGGIPSLPHHRIRTLLVAAATTLTGAAAMVVVVLGLATPASAATQPAGLDVSAGQGNVNWPAVASAGASFAYIKATEGSGYLNPFFAQQYNGSYNAGLIRGAYDFARPDVSDALTQANYFIANGGGWSADGRTLPGAVDIEYNPLPDPDPGSHPRWTCYDLSNDAMVSWLHTFLNRYRQVTGRDAVIYTTTAWWANCTGNSPQFSANPLWLACYCGNAGTLPASWSTYTFWQYADSGTFPGDQDVFNGTGTQLASFARTGTGTSNLAPTVTVLSSGSTSCPGSQQYFTAIDGSGVAIDWTYANASQPCVKVGYAPAVTTGTCAFSFYVPDGYATAKVAFGYWTTDGAKHYASLDESPVTGWQPVFSAAGVNRIEFQDNNGQTGTQIGWGTATGYGMRQTC